MLLEVVTPLREWVGGQRPTLSSCLQFPLGPGPEGPMAAMSAMEPHHVNGSLGEWASLLLPTLPSCLPGPCAPWLPPLTSQPACQVEASSGALSPRGTTQ